MNNRWSLMLACSQPFSCLRLLHWKALYPEVPNAADPTIKACYCSFTNLVGPSKLWKKEIHITKKKKTGITVPYFSITKSCNRTKHTNSDYLHHHGITASSCARCYLHHTSARKGWGEINTMSSSGHQLLTAKLLSEAFAGITRDADWGGPIQRRIIQRLCRVIKAASPKRKV